MGITGVVRPVDRKETVVKRKELPAKRVKPKSPTNIPRPKVFPSGGGGSSGGTTTTTTSVQAPVNVIVKPPEPVLVLARKPSQNLGVIQRRRSRNARTNAARLAERKRRMRSNHICPVGYIHIFGKCRKIKRRKK